MVLIVNGKSVGVAVAGVVAQQVGDIILGQAAVVVGIGDDLALRGQEREILARERPGFCSNSDVTGEAYAPGMPVLPAASRRGGTGSRYTAVFFRNLGGPANKQPYAAVIAGTAAAQSPSIGAGSIGSRS